MINISKTIVSQVCHYQWSGIYLVKNDVVYKRKKYDNNDNNK